MIYQPISGKGCTHCHQWKAFSDFYWRKDRNTWMSLCKQCTNQMSVQSIKSHPENHLESARRSHAKHKQERNEKSRIYGKTHREQISIREKGYAEKKRKYRQLHSEDLKERSRRWSQNNPNAVKAKKQRYRARKRSLPATLTTSEIRYCRTYWDNCCAICGRSAGFWNSVALDHWIPVTRGGGTTIGNIIPLCHGVNGCNNSKHNHDPISWLVRKFGQRKANAILKRVNEYFDHVKTLPPDQSNDQ